MSGMSEADTYTKYAAEYAAEFAASIALDRGEKICPEPTNLVAQIVLIAALGEAVKTVRRLLNKKDDESHVQNCRIARETVRRCEVILGRYGLPRTDGIHGIQVPYLDPFL